MPNLSNAWGNACGEEVPPTVAHRVPCDECERHQAKIRALTSALRLAGHAVSIGLAEAGVATGEVIDLH